VVLEERTDVGGQISRIAGRRRKLVLTGIPFPFGRRLRSGGCDLRMVDLLARDVHSSDLRMIDLLARDVRSSDLRMVDLPAREVRAFDLRMIDERDRADAGVEQAALIQAFDPQGVLTTAAGAF